MTRLRKVLAEAEDSVGVMPADKVGLLFLEGGRVVQPDPDRLSHYQTHGGQQRGHWPTNVEITAAMLDRYNRKSSS